MEATEPRKSPLYDVLLPKLELIYGFVSALGLLLLWNHVKGGPLASIVGLGGLATGYFLKVYEPSKMVNELDFQQHHFIGTGNTLTATKYPSFFLDSLAPRMMYISSACVLVGVLYKLMFWNGGDIILMATVPALVFFVLAWALNQRINRRAVVMAVIGVSMLCISSESLMRQLYRDDPVLIEAIVNQIHHPHDPAALQAYQQRMREYRHNH